MSDNLDLFSQPLDESDFPPAPPEPEPEPEPPPREQITLLSDQSNLFGEEELKSPDRPDAGSLVFKSIYVHFAETEDVQKFAELIGQRIPIHAKSLWYPAVTPEEILRYGSAILDPVVTEDVPDVPEYEPDE